MPYEFRAVYLDEPVVAGRIIDIMLPGNIKHDTAVFFIHGGGWTGGTREQFHTIMRAFNKKGFICGSTDYRLGKVTVLDQITDVRCAYDCFSKFLSGIGKPVRIFVIGSSAGAHLAGLLTLAEPVQCGEKKRFGKYAITSWTPPVGAALQATPVTFKPWKDIFPHAWTAMQNIVGAPYHRKRKAYERVSMINYVKKSSPPIFFLEAADEHMFPLRLIRKMVAKMKACGVKAKYKIYPNVEHGFFYELTRWQQKEAFEDILRFTESLK